jgi:hypothetical protein
VDLRQKKYARKLNGSSIAAFAKILDKGKPTRFAYEGAIRHGIRSYLVLLGETWADADLNAQQVLQAAFWRLKIARPSWLEGQPEATRLPGDRIYCANSDCQKVIEQTSLQVRLYCSEECRTREKAKRYYRDNAETERIQARAARVAQRALGEVRHCELCNRQFKALDVSGKKPQRFCSLKCRSRFASSCAASWRPPNQRDRQGRFRAT